MRIALLTLLVLLFSCNDNASKIKELQSEVNALNAGNDSLKKLISLSKPGLGELMLDLQIHHNKLWFAGREENWALAKFECDKMLEVSTQALVTDRPEVKLFKPMLYSHLDSIKKAIKDRDVHEFTESFYSLTNACNSCHKNTHFEFNKIQTPEHPPYSNQDFSTDNN
jgi:hypothetical protein